MNEGLNFSEIEIRKSKLYGDSVFLLVNVK